MRIAVSFLLMSGLVVTPADAQSRRTTKSSARSAPAKSAPSENAAQAWPIASLTVRGNQLYDSATILKVAGLKIGQKVGKDQFDAARDRLLATGAFTSVGYEFKPAGNAGFAATFDVAEIQQAYPWRFDSVKADEAKLRAKVIAAEPLFTKVMPGTDVVIKRVTAVVEEGLKEQGQPEPILGRVSDESGGDLQVVFRPSTLPSVAEVKFTGNRLFPTAQLQTTIASTAVGSVWTEKRFREILDLTIRPLYETRGRVRVAFPKLSVEPAKDVKGLVVTVDIDEGGEYELSDVVVEGTANSSRLVKESGLKTGATFDGKAVQEGIRRVVLAVQDRGYINATATSDRTIDDKEKKVKLAIKVSPGRQYQFGTLQIKGLDILTEPHIRKMWVMKPGAPFAASYPDRFLDTLRQEGLFENLGKTKAERKVDEDKNIVDVTLFFSSDGKQLPAIGPAREELERIERRKRQYPKILP